MTRPKTLVTKKYILDNRGHFRYYNPLYPADRDVAFVYNLDCNGDFNKKTGQPYPYLDVKTEKEFLWFIYSQFGEGEYLVRATLKGRKGVFTFWEGELSSYGWIFNEKVTQEDKDLTKDIFELDRLNSDYDNSQDDEEKMELKARMSDQEDWIRMQKDFAKGEQKHIRYGFQPFLESSGRRGMMHAWDEDNNLYDGPDTSEQDAELEEKMRLPQSPSKKKIKFDDMSIDDLNNFD